MLGGSNRIRTVPEYGNSRYLRNHKSYKKILMNTIFIIIYSLKNIFYFLIIQNIADISIISIYPYIHISIYPLRF